MDCAAHPVTWVYQESEVAVHRHCEKLNVANKTDPKFPRSGRDYSSTLWVKAPIAQLAHRLTERTAPRKAAQSVHEEPEMPEVALHRVATAVSLGFAHPVPLVTDLAATETLASIGG